jgi:isopentenyl-diphosphate delta-isomerase
MLDEHQRGLRHLAVSVFVMNGPRTLLQRRALGKYHTPGLWANACCTHPRWGEAPLDCATRRVREELGLTGATLRRVGGTEYRADVGGGLIEHEVVDLFVAEVPLDVPLRLNPDEVMQVEWVSLSDLSDQIKADPARFTPWLRIYLAEGWGKVAQTLQGSDQAHA